MIDGEQPVGQEIFQAVDPEVFEYGGVTVYSPTFGKSFTILKETEVSIILYPDRPADSHVIFRQDDDNYCLFRDNVVDFDGFIENMRKCGFESKDTMKTDDDNESDIHRLRAVQYQQLASLGRVVYQETISDSSRDSLGNVNGLIETAFRTDDGELTPVEGFRQNSARINEVLLSLVGEYNPESILYVDTEISQIAQNQVSVLRLLVEEYLDSHDDHVKFIATILHEDEEIRCNALNMALRANLLSATPLASLETAIAEVDIVELYLNSLRSDANRFKAYIDSVHQQDSAGQMTRRVEELTQANNNMAAQLSAMADKIEQLTSLVKKLVEGNDE